LGHSRADKDKKAEKNDKNLTTKFKSVDGSDNEKAAAGPNDSTINISNVDILADDEEPKLPESSGSEEDQNFFRYGVALTIIIVIFCFVIISVLMWKDSKYNRIFISGIDRSNYNTIDDITH
jgi:hypothetical protein